MDDVEENQLRNPFPSPPSHYINYTNHNLHLLSLLRTREPGGTESGDQKSTLSDQLNVPDWPLRQLEKPRVDWILEDGEYSVYGETWQTKERIPTLAELGGNQLYPSDPSIDRRPALLSILRSLLLSYSSLLKALLVSPPSLHSHGPPEWQRHMEWITSMGQNIMGAANDLRPVQARDNLEAMLQAQLTTRRAETRSVIEQCNALESKLNSLKASVRLDLSGLSGKTQENIETVYDKPVLIKESSSVADALIWAEELIRTE